MAKESVGGFHDIFTTGDCFMLMLWHLLSSSLFGATVKPHIHVLLELFIALLVSLVLAPVLPYISKNKDD